MMKPADAWTSSVFITGAGTYKSSSASSLMISFEEPDLGFPGRSTGQWQSRQSRRQSPHRGLVSSHFFLRRLHMRQPVCTRRILAFGTSPLRDSSPVPGAFRGRHGKLRRTQRAHGKFPSHACLICAQRWQTGRLSAPILENVDKPRLRSLTERSGHYRRDRGEGEYFCKAKLRG